MPNSSEAFRTPSLKVDVVLLHCGDLIENGGVENYRRALSLLASLDEEMKLVVAESHDTDLNSAYWAS